ncbi:hypothetical protein BCR32DRAFT_296815 [Anaeromyces robustus]|uniref:Homeobox domain-containing protein n=1 Tax=Anaeromyces robustus TaxID=1754192 RepID=A0A1Y1WQK7_9FUNG|nr:hypothetical protein BCR32DRAFT_296815 [Anaeromyces robustus]|eukprot:ORX75578.1 hypothetical protein BCR32DRAFT_296815 [Anaeromyces robustus]
MRVEGMINMSQNMSNSSTVKKEGQGNIKVDIDVANALLHLKDKDGNEVENNGKINNYPKKSIIAERLMKTNLLNENFKGSPMSLASLNNEMNDNHNTNFYNNSNPYRSPSSTVYSSPVIGQVERIDNEYKNSGDHEEIYNKTNNNNENIMLPSIKYLLENKNINSSMKDNILPALDKPLYKNKFSNNSSYNIEMNKEDLLYYKSFSNQQDEYKVSGKSSYSSLVDNENQYNNIKSSSNNNNYNNNNNNYNNYNNNDNNNNIPNNYSSNIYNNNNNNNNNSNNISNNNNIDLDYYNNRRNSYEINNFSLRNPSPNSDHMYTSKPQLTQSSVSLPPPFMMTNDNNHNSSFEPYSNHYNDQSYYQQNNNIPLNQHNMNRNSNDVMQNDDFMMLNNNPINDDSMKQNNNGLIQNNNVMGPNNNNMVLYNNNNNNNNNTINNNTINNNNNNNNNNNDNNNNNNCTMPYNNNQMMQNNSFDVDINKTIRLVTSYDPNKPRYVNIKPANNGKFEAVGPNGKKKEKESRRFPKFIIFILETSYNASHYPSNNEKDRLVHETGLTHRQINDWFINKRARSSTNHQNKKKLMRKKHLQLVQEQRKRLEQQKKQQDELKKQQKEQLKKQKQEQKKKKGLLHSMEPSENSGKSENSEIIDKSLSMDSSEPSEPSEPLEQSLQSKQSEQQKI